MNSVNLDNVPKTSDGRTNWRQSAGSIVSFCYKNISDEFKILKYTRDSHVLVFYNEKEIEINTDCIKSCNLGKLFNFANPDNYKHSEGEIIPRKYGKLKIINKTRVGNANTKAYNVECMECGYTFVIREGNLEKGDGCSVCSHHKTLKGYNDLWTTRKDIAEYLTNPNDGYIYSEFSNKKVDLTCCKCGQHIGKKAISSICITGISCKSCGDGISYPNKFIYHLLKSLNEDFDCEVKFKWCRFSSYNNDAVTTYGLYDIVIESKKLIIEMDSGLGHGNIVYSGSDSEKEETIYRDKMKTILAEQNGYKIIRINCKYFGRQDKFVACKNGIFNSELCNIYDFTDVNWEEINKQCLDSFLIEACNLYNTGLTSGQIAKEMKLSQCTIIDYLHFGDKYNLCKFIT